MYAIDETAIKAWQLLASSQFYSPLYCDIQDKHIEWGGGREIVSACQIYETYPHGITVLEEALTFPHHYLEDAMEVFDVLSGKN